MWFQTNKGESDRPFLLGAYFTDRILRSTIFFILQATILCSDILAPPLSSILMTKNIWIPCILGILIQVSGTFLTMMLPETLHLSQTKGDPSNESSTQKEPSIAMQFKNNLTSIFQNRKITVLVVSLSVLTIGNESIDFLLQYVSKRYDWSIAKVGIHSPRLTILAFSPNSF